ncbi:SGNH/GDSL hydrolase family protein [Kibdelosporangium aridum]|uniref:SGNH/GDSL hydrolase family protein n=1 Tax=Kibdelosporangium aridum TaxID=2030 RepID=UPI0035EE3557
MPTTDVALFGDSMLARFSKPHIQHLERELGTPSTVYNCAAGGWDSSDGAARAAKLGAVEWSVVVLSFGANDCAPWKHVPIDQFTANIETVISAFGHARVVAFLPPRIQEVFRPGLGMRRNRDLDVYRNVLRAAVGPQCCLEPGSVELEADGLHLTPESYTALIPALAKLISAGPKYGG